MQTNERKKKNEKKNTDKKINAIYFLTEEDWVKRLLLLLHDSTKMYQYERKV